MLHPIGLFPPIPQKRRSRPTGPSPESYLQRFHLGRPSPARQFPLKSDRSFLDRNKNPRPCVLAHTVRSTHHLSAQTNRRNTPLSQEQPTVSSLCPNQAAIFNSFVASIAIGFTVSFLFL